MTNKEVEQKRKNARVVLFIAPAVAFAPAIIGGIGSSLTPGCNEGNCYWGALPWATFLTLPIGFIIMIVGLVMLGAASRTKNPNQD